MPIPEIKVSWNANPPGQIGDRPRVLPLNSSFILTAVDDGELTIEFKNGSPLKNGDKFLKAGPNAVEVVRTGTFKFKCHLVGPDGQKRDLDPDDPQLPGGGGELEVVPDGSKVP